MVGALALTRAYNSGVATYDIVADSSTCTNALYGVDPVYAVVLSEDSFVSQVACEDVANWTFDMGTSGLTLSSIAWTDANNCTFNMIGIADATTFDVYAEIAALVRGRDSGVATYDIDADSSTCTDVAHTLDPVYAVVLSLDTFSGEGACENVANWTFDMGTSGLTLASIDYVDPTNCKFIMSGTPDSRFMAMAEAAALTGAVDSGVMTYTVATDLSTCTDAPQLVDGIITLRATSAALEAGIFDESVFTLNTATGEYSATVQTSGPHYATEPFFVRDGYILDSFTPPVIPGGLQVFPEFVIADVNADTGTVYLDKVDRFGVTDPIYEIPVFATGPTITNPIDSITYEAIAVSAAMVLSHGFGFRKFYPDALFDSSTSSFGADLAGSGAGSYINITFAEAEIVQKVVFTMLAADCTATVDLYGSNDGGNWTIISNPSVPMTLSSIGENTHEFTNYTAYTRYRFVVHTAASAIGGKILELGLFNKPMSTHVTTDLPSLGYVLSSDGSIMICNAVDMDTWSAAHPAQDLFIKVEPMGFWIWDEMDQVSFYVKSNKVGTVGTFRFELGSTLTQDVVCSVANTWERHLFPINGTVTEIYFTPALTKGLNVTLGGPALLNEVFGVTTGTIPQAIGVQAITMANPRAYMFYVPDLDDLEFDGLHCFAKYWDGTEFVSSKSQIGTYAGSTSVGYLGSSGTRVPVYAAAFDFTNEFLTDDVHGGYQFDFLVDRFIFGVVGNDIKIVGLSIIDKEVV
jgi:hypothetical protein